MNDDAGRDPAAATGVRLTAALFGYFALVVAVITLSPFDFSWPHRFSPSFRMVARDIAGNIVMFLPLGFLLRGCAGASRKGRTVVVMAAVISLCIETAQIFIRGRYVSPVDVVTNTCGAWIGVLLHDRVERWSVWRPHLIDRLGLDVPLAGLVYLLVPQLWLNGMASAAGPARTVANLLLALAGSLLLVALHRHRWSRGSAFASTALPLLAGLWFAVGSLPGFAGTPVTFAAAGAAVMAVTWGLGRRPSPPPERRFESETLIAVAPVYALYLVFSTLWPAAALAPWHGAWGFADRLNDAGVRELLRLLEQVCGFTLLGYAAAEWRGRRELRFAADLPAVAGFVAVFAVALELILGHLAGPGASLLRALLATIGGVYGAVVYHLARHHVQTLRGQRAGRATAGIERAA